MAERFRDEGRDVLLFVDNICRYTWPVPKCPRCWAYAVRGGLPADAGRKMGRLQGASPPQGRFSIPRSRPCMCRGRLDRPVACHHLPALDSTVVLSREHRRLGIYPAVDPSTPPAVSSIRWSWVKEHWRVAASGSKPCNVQRTARHHRDSGHGRAVARVDKLSVAPRHKIQRFLS